ncbi:MAG: glycosyltransferase family 4 protein [Anaerolineae bacterium]|nr:glycosyltransferase family 4 protein [Anaerolineae bacterium]
MSHDNTLNSTIKRIGFVGNHLPRQCGIATFTTDLCEAIATEYSETTCIALPVNDIAGGYVYPPRVRFELSEKDIASYRRAADFLNINNVDLVCLQHEYGIYGGPAGSHILVLLRDLHMPIVTTLHTILEHPSSDQFRVLQEVAALSDRVIVMSERGIEFLEQIYGVSRRKIDFIPHGIPDVPFADSSFHKDVFGVEGKMVLLSFGLLSSSKGIEDVIAALPAIVVQHPNVVYLILGATHPQVVRSEGETYRLSLQRLARDKGVESNVIFYNRFVTLDELNQFISAADIYITPYLNAAQITSGTLAYTLGAGKAVISTPYWYAEEVLADERGVLIPFHNPEKLAEAVIDLLDNDAKRDAMRKRAYMFGRQMTWPQVAQRYMESFERARAKRRHSSPLSLVVKPLDQRPGELPPLKLDHLHHMTDDTGILQHAHFTIPNYGEGYCIDDNARALIVSTYLAELELSNGQSSGLSARYLAFIAYAFNHETRRFRNFMDYQRHWLEENGSDDSHGRTLWALGTVIGRSNTSPLTAMASWLFEQALPAILDTTSPRAWAFAVIGIHEYLRRFNGDRLISQIRDQLAERLLTLYQANRTDEWCWYENELAYCNGVLPRAMLMCGQWIPNDDMANAGLESLNWLADLQRANTPTEHFVPIGSNGFYRQGGKRARFDQQPVEAQTMVSACLEAYRMTGDKRWYAEAQRAFEWYLGRNDLNLPIYDPTTGGCRDGLHPDRANENQGAESTLAFLQSWLELRLAENTLQPTHQSKG